MHEVESMFFVEKVPWHGLGVKLDTPPTIREAIVQGGLDWTVSTKPLFYKVGEASDPDSFELKATPKRAVIRDTDKSYLGTVGTSWTPLQNIDAFEFFQPFLDNGLVTLETAGALRKGRHVWILARIKGDPIEIAKGDTVQRYMLLANGHDGTMAATAAFTPIRTVCANTLAAAMEHEGTKMIRVVHSENIKENIELVQTTMDVANSQFVASAELYQELAKKAINKDDLELYIQRVFIGDRRLKAFANKEKDELRKLDEELAVLGISPAKSTGNKPGIQLIDTIKPLFEKGRGNDIPSISGTWWAAYNSISEYLSYERGKSEDIRLDSLWFGQGATANQKALRLAKEMALT